MRLAVVSVVSVVLTFVRYLEAAAIMIVARSRLYARGAGFQTTYDLDLAG